MITLQRRELELLHESNAIENIVNIDYRDPENVSVDGGHVGAYIDAQDRARCRVGLRGGEVGRWQRWIIDEQIAFGHAVAPARAELPSHVHRALADLDAALARGTGGDAAAEIIGALMYRFAAGPSFEASGRVARLIASYVATWCGLPILVVRAVERPQLAAAQRTPATMRAFVADKLREASFVASGHSTRGFARLGL